jgi:acetyltransferase
VSESITNRSAEDGSGGHGKQEQKKKQLQSSAGFRECGPVGVQLEEAILARRGGMRLIGPNCLGVMIPGQRLNATFAKTMALPGNVAFISQSGALCASVLDWSLREKVGFSAFLSVGSMLDVGWGDLIFYLADDLDTRSILIYMESIGDAHHAEDGREFECVFETDEQNVPKTVGEEKATEIAN